jgi:hypothetical protein
VREVLPQPMEDAVESVRVRVIEEGNVHRIGRLAERVGDKLRPEGGAADPDKQDVLEFFSTWRRDLPRVDIGRELPDARIRFLDIRAQLGRWREFRIAQPVMANHSVLVRVGDRARLEFAHGRESLLHERSHFAKKAFVETHPADVEGEARIIVTQKMFLKTRPERRGRHGVDL